MPKISIDENICKGCALCTTVCPKKIVELNKNKLNAKGYNPACITNPDLCIACSGCALICPDCAITIEK